MDEDFIIGIEEIDKQHRELLDRIELLFDCVRRGQSRGVIENILQFLESYAAKHFATEVEYMTRYSDPGLREHQAEHEVFLGDLAAFKEKFASLRVRGEYTPFLGLELARRLKTWFSTHVASVDREMGRFLKERMSPPRSGRE